MKSRRKIWSLPLALVTALMLVGLLGAVILAQTADPAPVKSDTLFEDVEMILAIDAGTTTDPVQTSLEDVFSDQRVGSDGTTLEDNPDGLAYTVVTTNPAVVVPSLSNNTNTAVQAAWWDSLGALDADDAPVEADPDCTKRQRAIGFSLTVDDNNDGQPDNAPDIVTPQSAARGLCADFGEAGTANQEIILQAFHWDMLTGPEMKYAAMAANLPSSDSYNVAFKDLTSGQRESVATLFTSGVIARGSGTGTMTLTNRGSDQDPAGEAGTATVFVKVSDSVGRFLANSVGDDFTVEVNPAELAELAIILPTTTDGGDVAVDVGFEHITGEDVTADNPERFEFTVTATAPKVTTIRVSQEGGTTFTSAQQEVNFSLTDGSNLPFQIRKIEQIDDTPEDTDDDDFTATYNMAEIVMKAGVTLTETSYEFTLTVNELGRSAANSDSMLVRILVAVDNTAPTFDTGAPTTGSVDERANGDMIATFSASDPNNQVLTYGFTAKAGDTGAARVLTGLDFDTATGVLTASEKATAKVPDEEPDYIEDDASTADVDESDGANEHVFIVTVTDGTQPDTIEFTLTVNDVDDPARGEDLNFPVDEDQLGKVDDDNLNSFGTITLDPATVGAAVSTYVITEQIDGTGVRTKGEDSLFGIDEDTGEMYLKVTGSIDFEDSTISNNYTLSVMATGANSNLVTIMVIDVNEAPTFPASYGLIETAEQDTDDFIGLYVLESAPVDGAVKIGKDAGGNPGTVDAQFVAEDEDTNPDWDNISYDLWYDSDLTDEELELDDLYAGPVALVKVDSAGRILVNKELDTDQVGSIASVDLVLRAFDPSEVPGVDEDGEAEEALLIGTLKIKVDVIDTNVAPEFDEPSRLLTHATVSEGAAVGFTVHTYRATDEDGDVVRVPLAGPGRRAVLHG